MIRIRVVWQDGTVATVWYGTTVAAALTHWRARQAGRPRHAWIDDDRAPASVGYES